MQTVPPQKATRLGVPKDIASSKAPVTSEIPDKDTLAPPAWGLECGCHSQLLKTQLFRNCDNGTVMAPNTSRRTIEEKQEISN